MIHDILYKTIGERIRIAREKNNLTQGDLAKLVGLNRTSITNIEMGRQKIQIHTLFDVAQVLHLPIVWFLPETDETAITDVDRQLEEKDLPEAERKWIKHILSEQDHDIEK